MLFFRNKEIPQIHIVSDTRVIVANLNYYNSLLSTNLQTAYLIQDILTCSLLSRVEKQSYINHLLPLVADKKLRKQVHFVDNRKLEKLFLWSNSTQGFKFWIRLSLILHRCTKYPESDTSKTLGLPYIGNIGDY